MQPNKLLFFVLTATMMVIFPIISFAQNNGEDDDLHMNWGEDGGANGWFSGDSVAFSGYVWTSWVQFNYSSDRKDIVNIIPNN